MHALSSASCRGPSPDAVDQAVDTQSSHCTSTHQMGWRSCRHMRLAALQTVIARMCLSK
jgi:hypothetical protein